ncbi:MAG: helix-turn-helix domain-containing protein [Micrococcales bacterium]|nr:helix-turn-helix domain-containing protein [Micrococcales bacterium]MCL2666774.1 helix-turn-helix domain-containing protein [Micrococcales bacterium]
MEVSVSEAAQMLGVSPGRLRALIHAGRVQARRVADRWLVEATSLPPALHRTRPMAPHVAWEFLADNIPAHYAPDQAYRWRTRRARLADDHEPERLLASWVASRADRRWFATRDDDEMLTDPRLVLSGCCDPRAQISAAGLVEAYVTGHDLDAVRHTYLLRPGGVHDNVVLHVTDVLPPTPVPLLLVAADLADHGGDREAARARALIAEALT